MEKHDALVPQLGSDGIPSDFPIISYTEKVLEEKELQLRRYIKDNYSKIRNVELELAELALQVKLSSGAKRSALEHLRKKIEQSTERIKLARSKEEQSRKIWEAAVKDLKDQEDCKQRLCEDLSQLVQESASAQFSRLEELKRKLETLNLHGAPTATAENSQAARRTFSKSDQQDASQVVNGTRCETVESCQTLHPGQVAHAPPHTSRSLASISSRAPGAKNSDVVNMRHLFVEEPSQGLCVSSSSYQGCRVERVKGSLVLQKSKVSRETSWTGAGFDVGHLGS